MIYKIIAHMAANDRALIAEGSCGSPRSVKVFLGECNVDDMYAWKTIWKQIGHLKSNSFFAIFGTRVFRPQKTSLKFVP